MNKHVKRWLSVALACALIVTCVVSGLVMSASAESIFTDDVPYTATPYAGAEDITNAIGTLDPNEDTLAATLGDKFVTEATENLIGDFKKTGDKMVHVSSFTIIGGTVYMTYYANTETAGEAPEYLEARLAYCPINNPSQMTILTVQGAGDLIEGQEVKEVYDTILMHKDNDEIYVMWTAMTSQYYRFYAVFDVATKTLGPVRVNRLKFGDVENDFSASGIRSCFINNGITPKNMASADIGIMQKLSTRVENGEVWYYTGMYCWQLNAIIKSRDLITWEVVAVPDFGNRSEYENATYVVDDKVYYFVRQFDGTNATKDPYGFLTYYDLQTGTWADPLLINDCQSRSDFFMYGGELYLVHAPKSRNGIGIVRVDRENLLDSKAVLVANFPTISGGSIFYPFVKVYGDELYMSYTVTRTKICLTKVNLANYFPDAASDDIVKNGDFEDGATNGWEGAAAYIKPGVGYNGSTGIHFDFQGWTRVNYTAAEDWDLEPNSTYRITYRVKGQAAYLYFGTCIDVSAPSGTSGYKILDGQWCTRISYFTTGDEPSIQNLYFGRGSGSVIGDTYVDDIVVEKVDKNLDRIVGGDMDDESIMFRNATGSLLDYVDDPVRGSENRVMTFTKDSYGALSMMRYSKGRLFKLSFDHYGQPFGFEIGNIIDINYKGWQSTNTDSEWTHYEYVFATFGLDGVETSGDAAAYSTYISGEVGTYIDNFSLKQIDCVEEIVLSNTTLQLRPGKTHKLTYTLNPSNVELQGGELSWKTSDSDIVTVDAQGNIQAVGKAGTSAVITLYNQCLSVSCTVTIPTEDKTVTAFIVDTGIGSYAVTDENYDTIIGAEARWNALTAAQREYLNELMPSGRRYPDLLAKAKEMQATLAEEFVRQYAFTDEGAITQATFNNCLWIATAADEWTAMSDATKAVVDTIATNLCGTTFTKLYEDALALIPETDPNDLPGGATDENANANGLVGSVSGTVGATGSRILMAIVALLLLAAIAAVVLVVRKNRAALRVLSIVLTLCMTLGFICVVPIDIKAITLTGNWLDTDAVPPITDYAYSIAVVGDTQVITDQAPDKLAGIYKWILDNKDAKNIGFVAGLGDITETNSAEQWQIAREAIMQLNGKIPFSIVEGNHDNGNGSTANMNTAFPVDEMFAYVPDGNWGVYEEGKIDNSYQLFEIAGIKYMMIALEFGPTPEILAWAGELCDQYADRNVILTTHAYLDGDANIMDENSAGSPHLKGGHPTTYGTTIWNDLITTHDNIVLAMSGHVTADNFKVKQEVGKYGQVVTNLMSNPQTIDAQLKHSGMVTMLYFSADGTTMTVQDYSTIQDQFYGEAVTVTVDKAQHRHKASTDVYSTDAESHWYACECGGKADEVPHAWTAWEGEGTEQSRSCVFCGYTEEITLGDLFQRVDLHRATYQEWQKDADYHWLVCDCDSEIHKDFHNWTKWAKTGTTYSSLPSIFSDDVPYTSTAFDPAVDITTAAGTINPNEDTLAATVGDTLAAEIKANIIADFELDGDMMVHVSSFTIIDGIVYMTYYANTATAGEDSSHLEARFAYCPLSDPSALTTVTVQKVGDTLEGRTITKVYDTILMNKNDGKIFIMWTAATTQYYRFYAVFDVATKTLGDIKVNRFKVGDIVNDMSISGIRSALINNGYSTKYMLSDIGIMQKLTAREENGEVWYYTGMYCWQFNCIIKSKDLITWEFVAAPDFDNRSEYENATFVLGDRVYYFVRQFDGTNAEKDPYGFLTYYDLEAKTWAAPVLVNDCQSRSDFFYYGGELYLVHAPKNRNGIGLLRVDQTDLTQSDVVAVANMASSCFYPYVMVYGDTAYISYTVDRLHIRLAKFDLTNFESDGTSYQLPDPVIIGEGDVEAVEPVHDMNVWTRQCPCGATETKTLPMGAPLETDRADNLIFGQIPAFSIPASQSANDVTHTATVSLKAGMRYAVRVTTRSADGTLTLLGGTGTINLAKTDNWRTYQYLFTPETDLNSLDFVFHHNGATVQTMMITNLQVLEAPTDGSFNLFAASDMESESQVFGYVNGTNGGPYLNGAELATDPLDPTNSVLKITSSNRSYFPLNSVMPGIELSENKVLEITFRRLGANLLVTNTSTTYTHYVGTPSAGTATWQTYTWYLTPEQATADTWLALMKNQWHNQGTFDGYAYVDDFIIREIPFAESFSFKGDTIKINATTEQQDLGDQLVVYPPNALPSTLTWSITDNVTHCYNPTTGKFDGTEKVGVTLNGSLATVAALGSDGGKNNLWSLANCTPTITVTSSDGLSATAKVEWVYPETVFNVDVDNDASGRKDTQEVYESETSTNKVMSMPTATNETNYFTVKNLFLKPNAKYLFSYRSKTVEGDTGRIYGAISSQIGIDQYGAGTGTTLISDKTTGEWITNVMILETDSAPAADSAYSLNFQRYGAGTNPVLVDDVKLELLPDDCSLIVGGDFELKSPNMSYYDRVIRNGLGTIVAEGDNHVLKLNPKIERGTSTAIMGLAYLQNNTAYKVTFRHKGGPFQFHVAGGDGWAATIVNVGSSRTYDACEDWTDETFYIATGETITNSGNWPSTIQLGTKDSTAPTYLDDIVFTEITAPFVEAVENTANRGGSLTLVGGGGTGKILTGVKPGDRVKVKLTPAAGYLPDPSQIFYTDRAGNVHPIFNNPEPMTADKSGGTGYVFAFTMPEDCVSVDAKFVSAAENGYQWGTIASAIRADGDTVTGVRFLNRLYIQGLDWSADDLIVTYGGVRYYVTELGAIARESTTANELKLGTQTKRGVAYRRGSKYVSVTDYTDAYLDFTVVWAGSGEEFLQKTFDCRAYMKLTAVDDPSNTQTLYTATMTDAVADVVARNAAVQ